MGSILANVLLILGMCFLLGGLKFSEQIYNKKATMTSSSLLALSVMSLLVPTVFHASFSKESTADDKVLLISHGTSVILLLIYLLYLVFQLKSHTHVYASMPQDVIELQSRPGPAARYFYSSSAEATSGEGEGEEDKEELHAEDGAQERIHGCRQIQEPRTTETSNQGIGTTTTPEILLTTDISGAGSSDRAIPAHPVNTTDEEEEAGRNPSSNHHRRPKKAKKRSEKLNKHQTNRLSTHTPTTTTTTTPSTTWQPQPQPRADFDLEAQHQPSRSSIPLQPPNPARSLTFRPLPFIPPNDRPPYADIRLNTSASDDPSTTATAAAPIPIPIPTRTQTQTPSMSQTSSTLLLLISTTLVSLHAEFMISSISPLISSDPGGLSEAFIGLILLPVVGNAAEHVTAVSMALKNKMDLAIGVAVGSSIQISLFITPLVVILGWAMQKEMSLFFTLFETVCVVASAFIVSFLVLDGRSNYLEGALLCAGYVIIGVAAFFYPDAGAANDLGSGIEGGGIS